MPLVTDTVDTIISSARRDNLTTHFTTNRLNIRRHREKQTGSVTNGTYSSPSYAVH